MHDRTLRIGQCVLGLANILNWLCVAGFAVVLILSFPFAQTVLDHLAAKYTDQPVAPILNAMRVMFVVGMFAGIPLHIIFTRLRAIVATVGQGDPFVAANARRLQLVGWALLAIQLLDLYFGGLVFWLEQRDIDAAGWSPSVGGWIAVLMVFVLARVFTIGTRMRDDLEMTV